MLEKYEPVLAYPADGFTHLYQAAVNYVNWPSYLNHALCNELFTGVLRESILKLNRACLARTQRMLGGGGGGEAPQNFSGSQGDRLPSGTPSFPGGGGGKGVAGSYGYSQGGGGGAMYTGSSQSSIAQEPM